MTSALGPADRARMERRVRQFRQKAGAESVPVDAFRLADRLRREGLLRVERVEDTVLRESGDALVARSRDGRRHVIFTEPLVTSSVPVSVVLSAFVFVVVYVPFGTVTVNSKSFVWSAVTELSTVLLIVSPPLIRVFVNFAAATVSLTILPLASVDVSVNSLV